MSKRQMVIPESGLAHLYVFCKGGNVEFGRHSLLAPVNLWSLANHETGFMSPTFAKTAKVGQPTSAMACLTTVDAGEIFSG